jgi:beta-lactam-binding protein with PASTA domain
MARILLFASMPLRAEFLHRRATHKNVTSLNGDGWLVAACGALMMLSGCGTDRSSSYALNVFVTGLAGSGLRVTLNGGAPMSISANSETTLARLTNGATYTVAITAQPVSPLQRCTAANPSGTINDNNVDVMISCVAAGVIVPSVLGMTQAAASASITGAGLAVGAVAMQSSATVAAGLVVSESPAAGSSVFTGSAVNLVVSDGAATIAVPNVVGLTQAAATSAITSAGLVVGDVTTQNSASMASGSVISEGPAAGSSVASGSPVSLVISSGAAKVAVPNVVGLSQAAANAAINGSGLVIGNVATQNSSTVAAGLVISESPSAGSSVAANSAVSVVVSSGAAGSNAAAMASLNLASAAIANGEATWVTLPHTDIASDLAAVAAQMVASRVVIDASVSENGVRGTLSDGTQMILVYDPRDTIGIADTDSQAAVVHESQTPRPRDTETPPTVVLDGPLGASTAHEIAFLIDENDKRAFIPAHQVAWANAFYGAGLPSSAYEVDVLAVTLENISALGNSHPVDYLNIATHGMTSCDDNGNNCQYHLVSDSISNYTNFVTYFADIQAHRIGAAGILQLKNVKDAETYDFNSLATNLRFWFTLDFVAEHLTFNPGAYLANDSCYAQARTIQEHVSTVLTAAHVGLYSGWSAPASSLDADQSTTYLLDRLLGEQVPSKTGLDALTFRFAGNSDQPLITEQTPPQRPFPLAEVTAAMASIQRAPSGFGNTLPATLVDSQYAALSGSRRSTLLFTPLNGGAASGDLTIWGLPSISTMQVVEGPTSATLTIIGNFPATAGTVQITDASGTYPLTPTSWTTQSITVSLPSGGNASSGQVQVFDVDGVPSNPVPLTAWSGTLHWQENDVFSTANGASGNGTGTIDATFSIRFRADVHPVVQTVDAVPVPQNFMFSGLMGSSQGSLTAYSAAISGANGGSATFSPAAPEPTMTSGYPLPLSEGQFNIVGNVPPYLLPTCNNGLPGPQPDPTTVFCPLIYMYPQNPGSCSGALCPGGDLSFGAVFGWTINSTPGINFGTLMFTMDSTTYAVTVTTTPALITTDGDRFIGNGTESTSVTGSVVSPTSPPSAATPAGIGKPASKFSPRVLFRR